MVRRASASQFPSRQMQGLARRPMAKTKMCDLAPAIEARVHCSRRRKVSSGRRSTQREGCPSHTPAATATSALLRWTIVRVCEEEQLSGQLPGARRAAVQAVVHRNGKEAFGMSAMCLSSTLALTLASSAPPLSFPLSSFLSPFLPPLFPDTDTHVVGTTRWAR